MTQDSKTASARGRSLAHRVAAKALGLDASETESGETRMGGLKMPFGRDRSKDKDDETLVPNCHIGVGSSFRGTLMVEGTLLVDGDFQGDILNCERILVGPYGRVRADVQVREAVVAGSFDGGIQAEDRVTLLEGARVHGDLTSHAIVIEDGVRFSGRCTMLEEEETSLVSGAGLGTVNRAPGSRPT